MPYLITCAILGLIVLTWFGRPRRVYTATACCVIKGITTYTIYARSFATARLMAYWYTRDQHLQWLSIIPGRRDITF